MQFRQLGRSNLTVSVLSLGSWLTYEFMEEHAGPTGPCLLSAARSRRKPAVRRDRSRAGGGECWRPGGPVAPHTAGADATAQPRALTLVGQFGMPQGTHRVL